MGDSNFWLPFCYHWLSGFITFAFLAHHNHKTQIWFYCWFLSKCVVLYLFSSRRQPRRRSRSARPSRDSIEMTTLPSKEHWFADVECNIRLLSTIYLVGHLVSESKWHQCHGCLKPMSYLLQNCVSCQKTRKLHLRLSPYFPYFVVNNSELLIGSWSSFTVIGSFVWPT